MKKKRCVTIAVLLMGVFVLTTSCSRKNQYVDGETPVGEIVYMEGEVLINGTPVQIGDTAVEGDVINTGDKSYAEVQFGKYSIFKIANNASLKFNFSDRELEFNSGELYVVQANPRFKKFLNKPLHVKTPTTVAAVRGTTYYLNVNNPETTYFCLCNGRITLTEPLGNTQKHLDAKHHSAVWAVRKDDRIIFKDSILLFHTDDDMEALADRIDVVIDWDTID